MKLKEKKIFENKTKKMTELLTYMNGFSLQKNTSKKEVSQTKTHEYRLAPYK